LILEKVFLKTLLKFFFYVLTILFLEMDSSIKIC